ncbi:MAG: heme exporter protein CcmD [Gammaproteobacteria bacterium]|nr:heme exporter protein CcmD [Gammaproteobacteria bacterium]
MTTLIEKLAMGGYAGYVWTSIGAVVVTLIFFYFFARKQLKKALEEQDNLDGQQSEHQESRQGNVKNDT